MRGKGGRGILKFAERDREMEEEGGGKKGGGRR